MWYNGNTIRTKKKTKKVKGANTLKYGWRTSSKKYKPVWKTNGITKVEKRNLNYLLDEYDDDLLKEDKDYFKHHETLHSLSVNWQTGADPRDKFRDPKVKSKKKNKKKEHYHQHNQDTKEFRGSVDCFKPDTFDIMRTASRRKAKKHAEKLRQDKIRHSYDNLKRNVYKIKRPQNVKKMKYRSKTFGGKMREISKNLTSSRIRFEKRKDQEFAKSLSKSIQNTMKFKSMVSKRNKNTDIYLKHVKGRHAAAKKIELIKSGHDNNNNNTDDDNESEKKEDDDYYEVEKKVSENDFMNLTLDEMYETVVVKKTAFMDFSAYDFEDQEQKESNIDDEETKENISEAEEDDETTNSNNVNSEKIKLLEEAAIIRDLQIDIGKIMSIEKMYKISDLRNFFYEIISRYEENSNEKILAQKAIFEICANLDIMAVGNLVMESPAKLPIRLYAETGSI